ncbi:MAG: glycosyltransferase family 2 protein [Deltaproteobacteria bacterium]|nr:MAG: glycosyltransferase family 2 protein [Deltaproteobacteria bacterium]
MTDLQQTRVSVLIVNWNGLRHLQACLDSLAAQSFRNFEVVLVDNGSVDGSVAFVRERYPWVQLVELPENSGFAGGNNAGLPSCRGTYVVTLNNDTVTDPGWLAELVRVADANPRAGMVGCRICRNDDPECLDSLGVKVCADGNSRGAYRGARFSALAVPEVMPILLPSACAALYRRAMLDEIGFFDEEFFAYCEDTDLGLRGRLAGWDALLASNAVVLHKYSQTGGALSPFKLRLVERNHYWAAMKNFPATWLLLLPLTTLHRLCWQVRQFLSGRWRGGAVAEPADLRALAAAMLAGMGEALSGLPQMLAKRRRVQAGRRIRPHELARLLRAYRLSFGELFHG